MISLDLTKSSEVRKAGDLPKLYVRREYINVKITSESFKGLKKASILLKPFFLSQKKIISSLGALKLTNSYFGDAYFNKFTLPNCKL